VILALLQGISLVRRNNEWHHFDPLGTAQVITNNSPGVVSNNVYDLFGVLRYQQGSAQTPWRWRGALRGEESLLLSSGSLFVLPRTGITSLGFLLPGIGIGLGIGVALCIYEAYREARRDGFGAGFIPDVPLDKLQHCFVCCRIVRCTAGLGAGTAFIGQLLWEGDFSEASNADTRACMTGIGIGYIFTESCLTGCARPVSTVLDKVVLPILRLLRPIRFQL
jgi:hypothetical protein